MVAGFIQAYLVCPVELIKIRLQTRVCKESLFCRIKKFIIQLCSVNYEKDRIPAVSYAKHIFATEGLNGFYRGITPTLCRDVLPYGKYSTFFVL